MPPMCPDAPAWSTRAAIRASVGSSHGNFAEGHSLWLEDNDRALARRVAITYRSMRGRPTFIADLSDWNLNILLCWVKIDRLTPSW